MITALAALEAGVIQPEETVYCPGFKEVGGRRFHCWSRGGHGQIDLLNSISESCDVYYYDIAERVGIEKITEMARRFGLGVRHDVPLSAVSGGLTPNKAWKRENRGAEWVIGDTLNSHRAGLRAVLAAAACGDDRAARQRHRHRAAPGEIRRWRRGSR
jgi:penicillin-binding protein 2